MSGQRCRGFYGDFDSVVEATAADDAADGMITAPGGDSDEAGVARRQGWPIGALRDAGLDERRCGRPWTRKTDRHSGGD